MNKIGKIIQCIKYRRYILGRIGRDNKFRPGVFITSAADIGNNNFFGDRTMVGNAKIGNYCSFGPDVKIAQSQHSIDYVTTYQSISEKNVGFSLMSQKAIIDNDVWIGANAVIMQGVHISTGAVIGANAVVTKDVPPYAIVVGIPAKIIRYRFPEETIDTLLSSKWWDNPFPKVCDAVRELEKYIRE